MNSRDTNEAADQITDEVSRLAWSMVTAVEQVARTTHDPAAARVAKLAISATLLNQVVQSEAELRTLNDIFRRLRAEWTH